MVRLILFTGLISNNMKRLYMRGWPRQSIEKTSEYKVNKRRV